MCRAVVNYKDKADNPHSEDVGKSVEARLRKEVMVSGQDYCFMPRKSSTDTMFALRIITK